MKTFGKRKTSSDDNHTSRTQIPPPTKHNNNNSPTAPTPAKRAAQPAPHLLSLKRRDLADKSHALDELEYALDGLTNHKPAVASRSALDLLALCTDKPASITFLASCGALPRIAAALRGAREASLDGCAALALAAVTHALAQRDLDLISTESLILAALLHTSPAAASPSASIEAAPAPILIPRLLAALRKLLPGAIELVDDSPDALMQRAAPLARRLSLDALGAIAHRSLAARQHVCALGGLHTGLALLGTLSCDIEKRSELSSCLYLLQHATFLEPLGSAPPPGAHAAAAAHSRSAASTVPAEHAMVTPPSASTFRARLTPPSPSGGTADSASGGAAVASASAQAIRTADPLPLLELVRALRSALGASAKEFATGRKASGRAASVHGPMRSRRRLTASAANPGVARTTAACDGDPFSLDNATAPSATVPRDTISGAAPRAPQPPFEGGPLDLLLQALKVLVNLTNHQKSTCEKLIGDGSCFATFSSILAYQFHGCALRAGLPYHFDSTLMAIGVLINIVEECPEAAPLLGNTPCGIDVGSPAVKEAFSPASVSALGDSGGATLSSLLASAVRVLLQPPTPPPADGAAASSAAPDAKIGAPTAAMEREVAGAYASLLLGFLCRASEPLSAAALRRLELEHWAPVATLLRSFLAVHSSACLLSAEGASAMTAVVEWMEGTEARR